MAAPDLGVNEGTLGNWVKLAREAREGTEDLSKGDIEELKRLRAENAELRMAPTAASFADPGWTPPRLAAARCALAPSMEA